MLSAVELVVKEQMLLVNLVLERGSQPWGYICISEYLKGYI